MSAMDLANYLRHRIQSLHTNNTDVAQKAGIARQTLHRLLNAEIESARLSTLNQLANALHTTTLSLLRIYYNEKTFHYFLSGHTPKYAAGVLGIFNIPPKATVAPSETFTIVWELANIGSAMWENLRLICMDNRLQDTVVLGNHGSLRKSADQSTTVITDKIPIPVTPSGEHARLTATFRAPDQPCTLISHWQIVDGYDQTVMQTVTGLFFIIQVKTGEALTE